ncbi:Alpha-xylosidase [Cyphellophora attinorum]|uniref:Alpha-xylosidase n=1 Tax=Cyphellophora attinorum TaxID=1664694 RepID=A0A0N1P0D0_9EURO|nr:Alpha-xylosidase [Phialophora attinorum]KPI40096.1 Alpha-xylosidase [Phialophora attinorum]
MAAFKPNPVANPANIIGGTPTSHHRFTLLTPQLLRFEYSPIAGEFEDRASTFAINRGAFDAVPHKLKHNADGAFEIITDFVHLDYDGKEFSPSGLLADIKGKTTLWGAQWRYGQEAKEGGSGNLGGTARTLDEVDGRCALGVGVCSTLGYAVIDDSGSMLFDNAEGKDRWVKGRKGREAGYVDGYLFAYGKDYKAAIKDFYKLSGKQPVVPRWALGNWWSRYHRYDDKEYLGLMDDFKKRDVPLSVAVIDMDWHYTYDERVPHAGWTGYTWDESIFPDPERFGREIHSRGLKMSLNDHPHSGVHHHEKVYEEMAKILGHETKDKLPILFDPTSKAFMDAYSNVVHRDLERMGCDFWWIDWQQGNFSKVPGVDPLWVLNHFVFEDNREINGKHPVVFSRYAGPGSHRYPIGFSGDTVTTWESLAFQPEFTATASNIGYGWWSHDIGGHMFGSRDDELVTRWVQLGVLSPVMRLHSTSSQWMGKEPWHYRKEGEVVIEDWMRFRHRLLPYLYTLDVNGANLDEPLVQPMYWHFPQRHEAYQVPNQYFFGFELVVAPIVTPRDKRTGLAVTKAWLPPLGRFVDIFTGTVYDGDRELNLYRPLGEAPVLAHEGSIVPLDANHKPSNGAANPEAFEVYVVVGRNGQFSILEDPADDSEQVKKEAPASGERGSLIQWKQAEGKLAASVTGRTWSFRFLSMTEKPKQLKVSINGKDVTSDAKVNVYTYPELPSLKVDCPYQAFSEKYNIEIELGPDPQLSVIDHKAHINELLLSYQTEFTLKDKLWSVVNDGGKGAANVKAGKLMSLGIDAALMEPIAELILSDSRGMNA